MAGTNGDVAAGRVCSVRPTNDHLVCEDEGALRVLHNS